MARHPIALLPLAHLSYWTGQLSRLESPRWAVQRALKIFAGTFKLDMSEAEKPLEAYASVGELFARNLKPGARPIGEGFVSPVDGTLRDAIAIESSTIPQVKGKSYGLSKFLGSEALANRLLGGNLLNFYLSPPDYHHVHTPMELELLSWAHVPGSLFPVNNWSWNNIDDLFGVNERLVMEFRTTSGALVVIVMIAATNVGGISTPFTKLDNRHKSGRTVWHRPERTAKFAKGERIGGFELGSSVVILTEKNLVGLPQRGTPCKVRMGEPLTA
jgi:phosphatidylserine decarboxylase